MVRSLLATLILDNIKEVPTMTLLAAWLEPTRRFLRKMLRLVLSWIFRLSRTNANALVHHFRNVVQSLVVAKQRKRKHLRRAVHKKRTLKKTNAPSGDVAFQRECGT
jgi:hypothetical protein